MTLYLIDLESYDDTASPPGVEVLRFGSHGYATKPSDTLANTFYEPRLKVPANYQRALFGNDGTTQGQQSIGIGETVLIGNDGALDYLRDRGLDGRKLTIWALEDPTSTYASRQAYLTGTVEQPTFSWNTVTLRIRDRLAELSQRQIQETLYAGTTTASAATAEGNADVKGAPKPRLYGKVRNIKPVPANAYDLIYQVNDGAVQSIDGVYSNGAPMTFSGNDRASLAALRSASIVSGQYDTCKALGLFRLGSAPAGMITADVTQGATAADRTAAQIVKAILTGPGGFTGSDYDNASFTALDAKNSSVCGIYIDTAQDILTTCSAVLNSIGGWIIPNRLGVFSVGRFEAPAPTASATFSSVEILDRSGQRLQRLATGDQGRGVPCWRVCLNHTRNYATLTAGQLAGSVSAANASFFNAEWRTEVVSDAGMKVKHLLAPSLTFDTLLTSSADAATEAARRLALYSAERDRFLVPLKSELAVSIELGDTIKLVLDRYNMEAGRNFVVIGITENAETGVTELDVWG
jgi:hypothetical protein